MSECMHALPIYLSIYLVWTDSACRLNNKTKQQSSFEWLLHALNTNALVCLRSFKKDRICSCGGGFCCFSVRSTGYSSSCGVVRCSILALHNANIWRVLSNSGRVPANSDKVVFSLGQMCSLIEFGVCVRANNEVVAEEKAHDSPRTTDRSITV